MQFGLQGFEPDEFGQKGNLQEEVIKKYFWKINMVAAYSMNTCYL